ncbi:DUF2247 family protein [Neisseria sp.]|uniref:DUF2247 family protein n=1 Tax=Neisseria sp. TaxID=192066 RepID=UPI0026DBDECF|nr:DUF2247 family protein [Neisseria sp.]MDO4906506.1 DUF2247 family protein [Neisseria sp.]
MISIADNDLFQLSWEDIKFGYGSEYLGWIDVVNFAKHQLNFFPENDLICELSLVTKSEAYKVGEIISKLSPNFDYTDYDKKKWLYLVLKSIYENKDSFNDPLGEVEKVYEDFDYPEEIEPFVRYMPNDDWQTGMPSISEQDAIRNLYSEWDMYLKKNSL